MSDAKAEARKAAAMVAADLLRDAFERKARPVVSIIDAAIDAYEAALEKAHVLVPREPTEAMIAAGTAEAYNRSTEGLSESATRQTYRAMIAAAEPK